MDVVRGHAGFGQRGGSQRTNATHTVARKGDGESVESSMSFSHAEVRPGTLGGLFGGYLDVREDALWS